MAKTMTTEEIKQEIERLKASPDVKAARAAIRERYKLQQQMYRLRYLEKMGKAVREATK